MAIWFEIHYISLYFYVILFLFEELNKKNFKLFVI